MTSLAALIFDLDGVLVDSEPWWAEARAAVARRHARTWTRDDESTVKGANSREWSAAMRSRLGLSVAPGRIEHEVVRAMIDRYRDEAPATIEPGIRAVGRLRDRYPLAVASSAHPEVIAAALGALGLEGAFRAVVSSDEVSAGKPAPDVYLEAARRLGVPPATCLVVEDSSSGVRAARSAGMRVAWVGRAVDEEQAAGLGATMTLASLDLLDEAVLERLTASG